MFTQYMFNGLTINPAYSSIDDALSFTGIYRQQWTGFEGAPNTQSFSVHSPLKSSKTSMGLMIIRDHIGEVINETGAHVTVSQKVKLDEETFLAACLVGGFTQHQANYSLLHDPVSANDPNFPDQNEKQLGLGFGLMFFSNDFYLGLSSPFFFSRSLGGSTAALNQKPHFLLTGGYLIPLSDAVIFKPNGLAKYVAGSPLQVDLNANFLFAETVWLGASWRSFESIDAIAQVAVNRNIQLGYSYDFNTTALNSVSRGSHEIMLKYRIPVKGLNFPKCYF